MPKKKTLYMETTEVPADRTAAEICSALVQSGATHIATDYEQGKITGLRWSMNIAGRSLWFAMPARVEPIYNLLTDRASGFIDSKRAERLQAQAERVAWRQLLRWVQAQLAMIDCGMAESAEVFLPYMVSTTSGQTLYSLIKESGFKALPAPEKPQ